MRLTKFIKVSGSGSWWILLLVPVAIIFSLPLLLLSLLDPKSWRFNKEEARTLLRDYLSTFQRMTLEEIKTRLTDEKQHCTSVIGPSETEYQIEITPSRQGNDLLLLGGIDDGRLRAFFPLCEEILVPDKGLALE